MMPETRYEPGLRRRAEADPARFAAQGFGERLRALVLLAGSVRPSELMRAVDRSLVDLPVEEGLSVLGAWQREATMLTASLGLETLPIRVIIDRFGTAPSLPAPDPRAPVQLERDLAEYRGTGGVLCDAAADYAPDDLLVVANAGQILAVPLAEQVAALIDTGGDIALNAHADGTPVGLMLIPCGALAGVKKIGFVDFKEQVLPALIPWHDVRVVLRSSPGGFPVRSLEGYLAGLRAHHRLLAGKAATDDPFDEDWRPTFAIVEPGAVVERGARVHDAVVLAGARVERGAVVVRSVVCPGAVIRAGRTVADQIVTGDAERSRRPA